MSKHIIVVSFNLHKGQLDNWKKLSKEVDTNISKADGFISRDSGIDTEQRVYCIVKWESKQYREEFMKRLLARDDAEDIMNHFASIVDMTTEQRHEIEVF